MKKNPLEFIIEIKIDNLNDRDLCNVRRMGLLLNIFKEHLFWEKSDGSLVQPVYMSSAKKLGDTKEHLRPNEPEGVVIHLASDKDFSSELKKLQTEISPLWKLRPCPRDMKRTSMERHFRRQNFLIDWCSFRLSTTHHWAQNGNNDIEHASSPEEDSDEKESGEQEQFHFRSELPQRTYGVEILIATVIPGTIGGFVGFILIVLLWADRDESEPIDDDSLFFEAAFRLFNSIFRLKRENGNHYLYKGGVEDEGFIVLTRDKHFEKENIERDVSTPLPPQYGEVHPNGAPALTYAV